MAKPNEAPRRLEQVNAEVSRPRTLGLVGSLLHRVPTSVTAVVAGVFGLLLVSSLGFRLPGRDYVRSVFSDPTVFLFARVVAVVFLVTVVTVLVWLIASVVAHIKLGLWVRRPLGFDAQALHRGADDVDGGLEDVYRILDETKETNAEFAAALERTNRRVRDLEWENARLRDELGSGERQLSLGGGS